MRHFDIRIRVRLLSEAIWDSGEQAANHVHTQALSDTNGFVYYHAKTFKGQLKKQAIWLYRLYKEAGEKETAAQFIEAVADLFGWGKEEEKTYQIENVKWRTGIMRLGHLELPDAVKKYLLGLLQEDIDSEGPHFYHFSPQDLLEAQTQIRAMIQLENQIVKDRMFRLFHTVKEEMTFESRLEFETLPQLYQLKTLLRIVCSLERLGAGVNRGRGKVKATLWINGQSVKNIDELTRVYSLANEKMKHSAVSTTTVNEGNGRYYVLEIYNEEPLKIGASGSKSNPSEESRQHIPGSTIRGAIIAELIKQGVFTSDEQGNLAPEDEGLLHHVHCQSGYVYKDGLLFFPTPQHLRMNKHQYREKKAVGENVKLFDLGQTSDKLNGKNQLPCRYVAIRQGAFVEGKVSTLYHLHHNTIRNRDEHERENIYNYQAIAPGHTFRAIVYDRGQHGNRLEVVLAPNRTQIWYLGGSRSAGYGRCQVTVLGRCDTYDQAAALAGLSGPRILSGNVLMLTCLTDCLFRDTYGQPQSGIDKDTIEQWLLEWLPETRENPIGVKSQEVFLQASMSEGYNSTWGARYPKETILMAGSVMRFELTQSLSENQWLRLIQRIESVPHGSRTQEGFGWLRVNVDYPCELLTKEPEDVKNTVEFDRSVSKRTTALSVADISEEDKNTLEIIKNGLKQSRFNWLEIIAYRLRKSSELHLSSHLKRGHLYRMIGRLQGWLKQNGIQNQWLSQDFSDQPVTFSAYEKDADQFALWGVHLEDLMNYLSGEYHQHLQQKASYYLSGQGKFYYEDNAERIFIAELLTVGLYIASRERKGESIDD